MVKLNTSNQLQIIDIENLLGNPRPDANEVRECQQLWNELIRPGITSQSIIACNHGAAETVMFEWLGSAQRLLRSGQNGADDALLQEVANRDINNRFSEVLIGSGDHIFTDLCVKLISRGVKVTVVSRRESLAKSLAFAATRVVFFERVELSDSAVLEVAA